MAKTAANLYIFLAGLSLDLNILSPHHPSVNVTPHMVKSWTRHWLYPAYVCPRDVSSLYIDLRSMFFISTKFWAILIFYFFRPSVCFKLILTTVHAQRDVYPADCQLTYRQRICRTYWIADRASKWRDITNVISHNVFFVSLATRTCNDWCNMLSCSCRSTGRH